MTRRSILCALRGEPTDDGKETTAIGRLDLVNDVWTESPATTFLDPRHGPLFTIGLAPEKRRLRGRIIRDTPLRMSIRRVPPDN